MKLLVTAFDPFGGETINPALEAVNLLPDQIDDTNIIKLEIPTVFEKSIHILTDAIQTHHPDVVLCVGQAGGRTAITPERVAINIDDAGIPDNEGNQPLDKTIRADGAPAYFTTLPIKAMVARIREAGIPAKISNTAGTFVCNHLMYGLLYTLSKHYPQVKGGFVHVPFIPSQVKDHPVSSMELADIVHGLECGIRAIAENNTDIHTVEGATH
ncbi:MAG: pyroglutamyl-peptidase I [Lachnospiraceae bacterium]|nr:pyroglutamyl-peptidase I [Lachnospiraceae bacterium]